MDVDTPASSAQVVAFPLNRRATTIRECAATLDTLHGRDAIVFWQGRCRQLAAELMALGCSEEDVTLEVLEFQDEVQAELARGLRAG